MVLRIVFTDKLCYNSCEKYAYIIDGIGARSEKMLRVVICDDEKAETEYLTKLVQRWADSKGVKAVTSCFPSAEAFLFDYEDNKSFDLLLIG